MELNRILSFRMEMPKVRAPASFRSLFQCPLRRNLTGRGNQTVNNCFYILFAFTSWWRDLLTCRHFLR